MDMCICMGVCIYTHVVVCLMHVKCSRTLLLNVRSTEQQPQLLSGSVMRQDLVLEDQSTPL